MIAPADPGYDQAWALFYGGFEELRPAAIICPADAGEVEKHSHSRGASMLLSNKNVVVYERGRVIGWQVAARKEHVG